MAGNQDIDRTFKVVVKRAKDAPSTFHVSYFPRVLSEREPKKRPFSISVREGAVVWQKPPSNGAGDTAAFEKDARRRVEIAQRWLGQLDGLLDTARKWAGEFDWATRMIEKPMEDSEIGTYEAPALLLQEDTTRMLLEPIARRVPAAEGVVDFYVMPAFDDIATLYLAGGKWRIHYAAPDQRATRDDDPKPFTKANFRRAVEELRQHAK